MASSIYLFLFIRLFFLLSLLHLILAHSPAFMQPLCHDDERSALLQFKESFIINKSASYEYPFAYGRIDCQKVASWSVEGDKSDCCSWDGVECDEDSGYVIGLHLRSSCLYGSINSNSSLFHLVHLQRLDLSYNHFNYSPIPPQVRNLSRLTYLNLTTSMFSGQIPFEISQLSHLTSLDLGYNYDSYSGKRLLELKKPNLASLIENLTHLHKLSLDGVSIFSKIPTILANFSSLTSLSLDYCGLHGEFPVGIFKLPNLRVLQVSMNEGLIGYLRDFTWSNPLETLALADTSFFGELPASIGNLSHLTMLDVSSCNFSGSIPSSLGNLTNLTFLRLSMNTFQGEVPSSIFNLKNLQYLNLRINYFSGTVEFGEFVKLKHLTLLSLSYNQLSLLFKEPSANATLPKFQALWLSSCNLSKFPDFLINQDELEILDLSENNLHGPVPEWMLNIGKVSLEYISLANNFLTSFGDQHPILLPWTRLAILDLVSNLLQGSLPIPAASTLQYYSISNNSLTGNVPELFCNLSSIRVLDLANNNLSGSLPRCLDNFGASLSVLDLGRNKFQGSISDTWVKGSQLKIIIFSQNKFEGQLTRSLVNCTMLKVLDLGNNQFNDRFPSWLENLQSLEVLILRSNKFNGPIKTFKSEYVFPSLRIIDLSNNSFVGKLPLELFSNWKVKNFETADHLTYIQVNSTPTLISKIVRPNQISYGYDYSMTMTNKGEYMFFEKVQEKFTAVDMSNNRFIGGIPNSIDNLRGCRLLNLSNNILNGHIPPSLGNIVELEALDLSQNKLSGEIPPELTQLTFLGFFNVSHNNLTGPIPQGKQFTTFENDSFEGNPGLCGSQLTKTCENFNELPYQHSIFEESQDSRSLFEFDWKIIVIGYGFGFAVGVIIGHIVIARKYEWLMKTLRIRPLSGRRHRN